MVWRSARVGNGPVLNNGADISDDLAMVRPSELDGVVGADTSATRITTWAEPMVLGCASCACAHALVRSSVDSFSEDLIREDGVVRDNSSGQVMRRALTNIKNGINLGIGVLSHNLERSEKLSREQLALLLRLEVLERHEDASGLPCTVLLRDGVLLERSTTEDDLGALELKDGIKVSLNLIVVPRQDGSNREVVKAALSGLVLHLLKEASLSPVAVHEHHRLGGALLPSVCVSILIASVRHKVDIFLSARHIRSQDLPVVATVLKSNLAFENLDQVLANLGRSSEKSHLGVSLLEDLLHNRAFRMDHVHVLLG